MRDVGATCRCYCYCSGGRGGVASSCDDMDITTVICLRVRGFMKSKSSLCVSITRWNSFRTERFYLA